jgi:hypothetical protein
MNRILAAALLLAALGCKKTETADNAATQYTDGLQSNVQQAEDAAAKANAAMAASQAQQAEAGAE